MDNAQEEGAMEKEMGTCSMKSFSSYDLHCQALNQWLKKKTKTDMVPILIDLID